ncbi:MAG: nucleotidyl transferase AbiEii/AbiGii toxin family protein [Candidatus Aegiribacteria sp.]|nr:nucleotidyl transferase AbiEii/AbiGii toxin family protein [Candidatus Aegiribacteria sp.]
MHEKVLTKNSLELLKQFESDPSSLFENWILAGGTGLALQLGHRISDDFDFFRTDLTDARELHEKLLCYGTYETLQEASHTLTVLFRGTKLSFFRADSPFIFKGIRYRSFRIADIREIALMKLLAICNRGSRKDFIDLYTILRGETTLQEYFRLLPDKYGASRINTYNILKSLTYFEDAEKEPVPRMLVPFKWEECKAFFIRAAHSIVLL